MSGWTLDIKQMSWVENTVNEVEFILEALHLQGHERILDLACGFGRHALELARRGYAVVGVDYTEAYIADARQTSAQEQLAAEFLHANVLDMTFHEEFDVVLSMADGAIGYFLTEAENLKLFDVIGNALRPDGKHVMGVCSADYAGKHFPKRNWEAGRQSLSLADFQWNAATARMIYRSRVLQFGEVLEPFPDQFPADDNPGTRLYTLNELRQILSQRGLQVMGAYGAYDTSIPASDDRLMQVICSQKR